MTNPPTPQMPKPPQIEFDDNGKVTDDFLIDLMACNNAYQIYAQEKADRVEELENYIREVPDQIRQLAQFVDPVHKVKFHQLADVITNFQPALTNPGEKGAEG